MVRTMRWVLLPVLVLLLVGGNLGAGAAFSRQGEPEVAVVEQPVWEAIEASPGREATFVVVLWEDPGEGPGSAVWGQIALEGPLALLQRAGTVSEYTVYYGANAIVVTGTGRAVEFLAAWPEVAVVRAYEAAEFEALETARAESGVLGTGTFGGKVTGPDGTTGLGGMLVRAYRQSTNPTIWDLVATVTTAGDGTYTAGGLTAGIFRAQFVDPAGNYVPEFYLNQRDFNLAKNFDVFEGQTTTGIDAVLDIAGRIAGTVTRVDNGQAAEDISVTAFYRSASSWRAGSSAVSGGSGTYSVGGLLPDSYRVLFSDAYPVPRFLNEYYNNRATIDEGDDVAVTGGATTPNINAALGGYGSMAGTVYGEDGVTPLPDIFVDVYEPDGYGGWQWESFDKTDSAGMYEAGGLVTRDYRIEFSESLDPEQYAGEFYNNKSTVETGDDVHVELGLKTENVDVSLALKPMTVTVPLEAGWNLMSLSLEPGQPVPEDALADIAGEYNLVWGYEACDTADQWKLYNPSAPPYVNDLQAMNGQRGYWLDNATAGSVQVSGLRPVKTTVTLCQGWNLIGYAAGVSQAPATVLAEITGKYNLVYGYDASDTADPWKKYNPSGPPYANDLTEMRPGFGYWIRMTQAATLTIVSR